jgi:segregation and condensation protein B
MADNTAGLIQGLNRSRRMVMRLVPQDELLDEEEIQALEQQTLQAERARAEEEEIAEARDGAVENGGGEDTAAAESPDAAATAEPAINLALMEALLLSTHHPLTAGRLAELLDLDTTKPLRKAIKGLNEQYAATGRAFRIEQVAGGFQILTLPEFGDALKKLHQKEADAKLTKAALETLAIIAYKQPILRADVEAIRGCACGETIRSLMEKHLVKIAGRAEEPGRPILYGTTKRFLELFGLNNLRDLPQPEGGAKPEIRDPRG